MSNNNKIFWTGAGMLISYAVIMAAVIYLLNDCKLDKWKVVTWTMFMVYGVWQTYRWFQSKKEDLNDEDLSDKES